MTQNSKPTSRRNKNTNPAVAPAVAPAIETAKKGTIPMASFREYVAEGTTYTGKDGQPVATNFRDAGGFWRTAKDGSVSGSLVLASVKDGSTVTAFLDDAKRAALKEVIGGGARITVETPEDKYAPIAYLSFNEKGNAVLRFSKGANALASAIAKDGKVNCYGGNVNISARNAKAAQVAAQ